MATKKTQTKTATTNGARGPPSIHLISKEKIENLDTPGKVRFILDEVEGGKVLILERGLTPEEETFLIEQTMKEIDQDQFIGIEMQSYGMEEGKNFLQRMAMGGARPRMAVIGPAKFLQFVSKDQEEIITRLVGRA